jgi:tetrahydromethanopterin S-methyltransferase subunit G
MLTDKQIADALDLIDERYHAVITKYLQKVGKTIRDIGHLNASSVNLLVQLRRMGVDVQTIERELQKVTRLTKRDIKKLYRKAAQESTSDSRLEYLTKGVEPDSIRWESLVEDIWRQTAGAMDNLANTSVITEGYREAIDDAVQAVTMGAGDYNSVIRETVKRIGRAGIQVEYESTYLAADGQLKHRKRRLDSAVRQNVLDGVRQVQQKAQELIGEEIGADGVDISAHPNSAPDHEPVQGRRFDLENFRKMQAAQSFSDVDGHHYVGFERPITQWRCRHLVFYILLGVTRRMYTEEQLKSWEAENQKGCVIDGKEYTNYQATQLMRRIETEIRRQKDTAVLANESGDDILRRECQSNINQLTKKYNQVAEAAGLRKQMQRTRVEGFKPVKMEE